jgi:hypothetical protein
MIWKLFTLFALAGIKDCGNGQGRAKITGLTAVPASPLPGENYTMTVDYDLPAPAITGGTAEYNVVLNYIPVYSNSTDLCEQTKCPKETGPNTEVSEITIPEGIGGKLVSTVKWTDQDNNLIWCFESTLKI